jgi:hypothetical protein
MWFSWIEDPATTPRPDPREPNWKALIVLLVAEAVIGIVALVADAVRGLVAAAI